MTPHAIVGGLVTLAMVVVAGLGARRWRRLDPGGRWMVAAVWVSVVTAGVMLGMVLAGRRTRAAHEIQLLLHTTLTLLGFAWWHPSRVGRWLILAGAAAFAAVWGWVLVTERWADPFSTVSAPIAHTVKVAAAGYSLIALVRVTPHGWTRQLWFWFGTATMLIFGTEVVLDPLWQRAFGVRDDLLLASYLFTQVVGLAGYGLMTRGLWPAEPTPRRRLRDPGP